MLLQILVKMESLERNGNGKSIIKTVRVFCFNFCSFLD